MANKTYFKATEFTNVKDLLTDAIERFPDKIAFVIKNQNEKDESKKYTNITYTKMLEDIHALGTALFNAGYKGKRIAIIGKNRYEWALTHFTNLFGGIVSVPLDKDLQFVEFEQSVKRAKVDAIVFDPKCVGLIEELKKDNQTNAKEFISMDKLDGYKDVASYIVEGNKLLKKGKKEFINFKVDPDVMNILLFTSGTSAQSKAVMLSQRNIASNVYAMQLVEPLFEGLVTIAFLPFHHVFGSTCLVVMIANGIKVSFPDGIRYIAQNLREYKVSMFVGVPILVEAIYKNIKKEIKKQDKEKMVNTARKVSNVLLKCKIDLRRKLFASIHKPLGGELRYIIAGGAALDKEVTEFFNSIGIRVIQGYGLTETAPVIAAEDYRLVKPGSVGRALPGVEIEIVDKDENGIGEVRAKGSNIMLGYYEDPERTAEVLKDGWFHTGDLGFFDKDGTLVLTGRKKDMIVLKNGKKIFPEEIEVILNRLDIVEESFVFGMPKDDGDLKLTAKIVYNKEVAEKEYSGKSEEELREIVWEMIKEINKTFPTYKYIKDLILTNEELIKTTTKKIKRPEEMKKILAEV